MTQYRLHYAGCTFDLRDEDDAKRVIATIKSVGNRDAGAVTTVNLVQGTLQLVLSRYVSIALSAVAPEDTGPSVYDQRDPLVIWPLPHVPDSPDLDRGHAAPRPSRTSTSEAR